MVSLPQSPSADPGRDPFESADSIEPVVDADRDHSSLLLPTDQVETLQSPADDRVVIKLVVTSNGSHSLEDAEALMKLFPVVYVPSPLPASVVEQEAFEPRVVIEPPREFETDSGRAYLKLLEYAELGVEGNGAAFLLLIVAFGAIGTILACSWGGLPVIATVGLGIVTLLILAFLVLMLRGKRGNE